MPVGCSKGTCVKIPSDVHDIARGLAISVSAKVLAVASAYALNVFLAKMLGSESLGLFSLAFVIITSVSCLMRFGLDYVMLRHAAIFWVSGKKGTLAAWFKKALVIAGLGAGMATVCTGLLAAPLSSFFFHKPGLFHPLLAMAAALVPQTLLFLQAETLKGAGSIKASQTLQGDGGGLAVYGAALCLCLPFAFFWGVTGACWGFAAASWLGFLLGRRFTAFLRTTAPGEPMPSTAALLRLGMPLFFAAIASLAVARAAVVMLGVWETASAVGIFAIAQKIALLGASIQTASCTVMGPKIASMHACGETATLAAYYRRSTRFVYGVILCVLGLIAFSSPWIMDFLGGDFRQGAGILRILALGELVMLFFGPVSITLIMTGNSVQHARSVWAAAVLMLVSGGILIPAYGLPGALAAVIASSVAQSLIQAVYIWKILGFFPAPIRLFSV